MTGLWLIDPFVLRADKDILLLDRTAKRAHFMTERPYRLTHIRVGNMRGLDDAELHALQHDLDFAKRFVDGEAPKDLRCFEVTFSDSNKDKTILIVAPCREIVEKLYKIMRGHEKHDGIEHLTVDQLLGPPIKPVPSDSKLLVTHKLTMIYDDKEPPKTVYEQCTM